MSATSDANAVPKPQLSEWETLSALRTQLEADLFQTNKATLFQALDVAGVTKIVVTFDGYGDSGQIEDVQAQAGDGDVTMPGSVIEIMAAVWGQTEPERSTVSIAAAVESLAYDVLERTHCGWENNDGAYGNIVFDIAAHTITLDYNERYTATENHTHSF
ncbi:hypothetical protein Sj15T_13180 [Sphingobium sp. TA15]|uniref:DUF6878 domain-containing protein n=1 Tax=Sphingobium indicum (strain DSM 16413 / CCM 7287 / MTCC 6362 / UT26 / NBRC 101211 / UT26S) TaxID=452662 RepID=D4Z2M9_SPHIU|nr:DUF6878 family protein [Sphingobium indicum]BAI96861.1 hypothetical protein SJA_C1-20270 [Sphingobium indicum UT26S]BDD66297.1 hypothetical protein Sj15T_13180 [Sphingobium sp. TA15]